MALLGHWPLNGDTNDISGNGNNLTNYGAVIDADGIRGESYVFNTAYSYAHTNAAIYMLVPFTVNTTSSYTLMG
jgi:hypothetical protein